MISSTEPLLKRLRRMFNDRLSRRQTRDQTLSYSHYEARYNTDSSGFLQILNYISQCAFQIIISRARLITIAVFVTIYLIWIRDLRLVESLRFKAGLYSPVPMTISILESTSDANYPQENVSSNGSYYVKRRKSEEEGMFYEDRIIWRVEGFSKYIHHLEEDDDEDPSNSFGRFGNVLAANENLDFTNVNGLWIMGYGGEEEKRPVQEASIQAFMVVEHFKNNVGVDTDKLEVAVAMRAAIIGDASFIVRFEDGKSDRYHKEVISNDKFKGKGFCYYIFNVPFNKVVNKVQIKPKRLKQNGDVAVALVDKVIIVVAKRGITESFFHTMVPNNWC